MVFTILIVVLVVLRVVNGPMNVLLPGLGLVMSWNTIVSIVIVLNALSVGFVRIVKARLR